MIPTKELNRIGARAKELGFDYLHNTNKSWVDFVDKENRTICVEYDDVDRHDYVGIEFLCGERASPQEARAIYTHFPAALELLKLLEDAPKTRREDKNEE